MRFELPIPVQLCTHPVATRPDGASLIQRKLTLHAFWKLEPLTAKLIRVVRHVRCDKLMICLPVSSVRVHPLEATILVDWAIPVEPRKVLHGVYLGLHASQAMLVDAALLGPHWLVRTKRLPPALAVDVHVDLGVLVAHTRWGNGLGCVRLDKVPMPETIPNRWVRQPCSYSKVVGAF